MISRYALYRVPELRDRFKLSKGLPKGTKPNYNISPTVNAPVIINEGGIHTAKLMGWGLVAKGAKDANSVFRYKTYNIPSEKIFSRHSWGKAVRESRCLVLADGFYELDGSNQKRAYYIQSRDKSPMAFAGVYSSWESQSGVEHGTYSVVTIESNGDMPNLGGRMPIIIKPEDEVRWLDPAVSDMSSIYDMLRAYPMGLLEAHEVGSAVHSPKPNQPSLIDELVD